MTNFPTCENLHTSIYLNSIQYIFCLKTKVYSARCLSGFPQHSGRGRKKNENEFTRRGDDEKRSETNVDASIETKIFFNLNANLLINEFHEKKYKNSSLVQKEKNEMQKDFSFQWNMLMHQNNCQRKTIKVE